MSTTLIPIRSFLGKYYTELLYSSALEKYKDTALDTVFEQRFQIQSNKVQMIIDPGLTGMVVTVSGNEVHISKEFYDHPSIVVVNSLESAHASNPRSLYNPEIFSTIAYLICQNHTTFQIIGEIDEPIYVRYTSDYETFYNSVVVFNISNNIDVEIVEEIESKCALNSVTNYILHPQARLNLSTFYQNNIAAVSFVYRNIILQEDAKYNHTVFGKGSANVIDENRIRTEKGSSAELFGVISAVDRKFHSILFVEPANTDYSISVDYRDIIGDDKDTSVSFFPVILGQLSGNENASITVSNISLNEIPKDKIINEIADYISDIVDKSILTRMSGAKRFYDNKSKFLHFSY